MRTVSAFLKTAGLDYEMASIAQPKFNPRLSASLLIREHRWIPAVATLATALFLTIALATHLHVLLILAAAALLLCASYVWGYSTHALKGIWWRDLTVRPGGRLCIDNLDLESDRAWASFAIGAKVSQQQERPPYLPTLSTATELMAYATQAG